MLRLFTQKAVLCFVYFNQVKKSRSGDKNTVTVRNLSNGNTKGKIQHRSQEFLCWILTVI